MSARLCAPILFVVCGLCHFHAVVAQPPAAVEEKPAPEASSAAPAQPEATLPRLEDVPLPETEALLSDTRRDWVVLQDGRVLIVEPVFPRPNTLAKIDAERNALLADPKRRFSPEGRQRLNDLTKLSIFLPGKEASTEYQISLTEVKEIIHHEDLMLRRADQLIDEGETRKAFELMFVVARRDPQWPGLDTRQVRLAVADAAHQLDDKNGERALTFIESLYERKPVPDEADDLLDRAADLLIGSAVQTSDFRRARFDIQRIRSIDPRHPAADRWTAKLSSLARFVAVGSRTSRSQRRLGLGGCDDRSRGSRLAESRTACGRFTARLTSRYQRLLVGVPADRSAAVAGDSVGRRRPRAAARRSSPLRDRWL